jgi:two-component system nitrate/nitrite response regulator NarL
LTKHINILAAHNDCLVSLGVAALLHEEKYLHVTGQAHDFHSLNQLSLSLQPDIIILESTLTGLEGTNYLQTFCEQTHIPVIFLEDAFRPLHFQLYRQKRVHGLVHRRHAPIVLTHAINEVHKGNFYYCSLAKQFIDSPLSSSKDTGPLFSHKELQVLGYIAQDKNNKEIGHLLFNSPYTIESIKKKMLAKTNTKTMLALVCFAIKRGFITLQSLLLPFFADFCFDVIAW